MEIQLFIRRFKEAFGEKAELPIAFWYSEDEVEKTEKLGGCMFRHLNEIREGKPISLNAENIGCLGGCFYCGFSDMPKFVPEFVSLKEHYKESPELVVEMINQIGVSKARNNFINFSRIDNLNSLDGIEGLLFLATPDILSGLVTWTFFDSTKSDAVSAPFGSGCSSVITMAVNENSKNGYRTFIGFFDPSVRPWVESNILSFVIPMSRFKIMYETMPNSCLFNTPAWNKIKQRIE